MHPEIARALVAQHHDDLLRDSESRRAARRRFPRWHVSWTKTVLAPTVAPATAGADRAGRAGRIGRIGRRGSSLVIIISAHRSA
jgi:hypothetical protein